MLALRAHLAAQPPLQPLYWRSRHTGKVTVYCLLSAYIIVLTGCASTQPYKLPCCEYSVFSAHSTNEIHCKMCLFLCSFLTHRAPLRCYRKTSHETFPPALGVFFPLKWSASPSRQSTILGSHLFRILLPPYTLWARNQPHVRQGTGGLRSRLGSTASEGALAAAAAADAQAMDDGVSASLHAALVPHIEALAKADVRRVTFLSPPPTPALDDEGDRGRCACAVL